MLTKLLMLLVAPLILLASGCCFPYPHCHSYYNHGYVPMEQVVVEEHECRPYVVHEEIVYTSHHRHFSNR